MCSGKTAPHASTTLLGQAEGVREVTRAVGRGREQVGPLPGVHAKAVGELAGGVERVGGLYLDVVAQALEGRAVPALHEDLPLLGRHVLGKARVEHEHLGRGEGAEVVLGPSLHHARSLVGEKGLAPCALGTLEAPHEAVVGKALLLEHLQVDGPRGAREGPPAERLEEHEASVDGHGAGHAVVPSPLVRPVRLAHDQASPRQVTKDPQARGAHEPPHASDGPHAISSLASTRESPRSRTSEILSIAPTPTPCALLAMKDSKAAAS